jgi:hypothetical protein
MEKIKTLVLVLTLGVDKIIQKGKKEVISIVSNEDGDTNFISILVLLGIVLSLAGIFLSYRDQVLEWVDTNIGGFFDGNAGDIDYFE